VGLGGALCLSSWLHDSFGFGECNAGWWHFHEDKHMAPASPPRIPLSLQDDGTLSLPHSVVKHHQDVGGRCFISHE
jgi:hypothetical protein